MTYNIWGRTVQPTTRYSVQIDRMPLSRPYSSCREFRVVIAIGNVPLTVQVAGSAFLAMSWARTQVRMFRKAGHLKTLRGIS